MISTQKRATRLMRPTRARNLGTLGLIGLVAAGGALFTASTMLAPRAEAGDLPEPAQESTHTRTEPASSQADNRTDDRATPKRQDRFWVNPDTQAATWVAENPDDERASVIGDRIAGVAQGTWFTEYNPAEVAAQVDEVVSAADADGASPILVVYNMPNRDCGGPSGGGAPDHSSYRGWVDQVAAGLADRPATVVLEPDVLALMTDCMDDAQQAQVQDSMAYAAQALGAGPARVYYDSSHSAWLEPGEMAQRLTAAGIAEHGDGVATNTSNYRLTEDEVAYATAILDSVGDPDLGAVIDTSRNGNGPSPDDEWCDPQGRAIGAPSTSDTGHDRVDAFLWVKLPGEADGCAAEAGQFDPDLAYALATN